MPKIPSSDPSLSTRRENVEDAGRGRGVVDGGAWDTQVSINLFFDDCEDEWMDGWMDEWMGGWMDGRMDGRMHQ